MGAERGGCNHLRWDGLLVQSTARGGATSTHTHTTQSIKKYLLSLSDLSGPDNFKQKNEFKFIYAIGLLIVQSEKC